MSKGLYFIMKTDKYSMENGIMKLINRETNEVNFGVLDTTDIEFNRNDYVLKDFFDSPLPKYLSRLRFHKFNYIGLITDTLFIGIGIIDLTYLQNVFAYAYSYNDGKLFEFDYIHPGPSKKIHFPEDPSLSTIHFNSGKNLVSLSKDLSKSELAVAVSLNGEFTLKGTLRYDFNGNKPLRVLVPNGINCWTFTEKCACLKPLSCELSIRGKRYEINTDKTSAIYDWSAGYMKRETNWLWAAFSAVDPSNKIEIGGNFASFVNETYFTENAFWLNGNRMRPSQVIFSFTGNDPGKTWNLHDEKGLVNLVFTPKFERALKKNIPFFKIYFRQFIGSFSGKLKLSEKQEAQFNNAYGITEIHRSLW